MSTATVPPSTLQTDRLPSHALSIAELRHPSEHSRLLLALSGTTLVNGVAAIALLASGGVAALGLGLALVVTLAACVWLVLQVYRARMLGRAVKVTATSMPALHATLEDIRRKLAFRRRLDVYVVESHTPSTELVSYLGTRILVLKGDLIADLVEEDAPQLEFLLARHIGALKARHHLLTPVEVLLTAVESLAVLSLFLLPYRRATAYTGDQIAQAACGDVDAALTATHRLLVGPLIEPQVRAQGVFEQARLVRRRILPRLAQLFSAEPHPTNRYLNLILFTARTDPAAHERYRERLDPENRRELELLERRSPHRHPAPSRARRRATAAAWAAATAALLVAVALLASGGEADGTDVGSLPPVTGPVAPEGEAPAPALLDQSSEPLLTIPDDDPTGVADTLDIAGGGAVAEVEVDVSLSHTYLDDVELRLVSPAGTTVALPTPDASSVSFDAANASDLALLRDEEAAGPWTLQASDVSPGDEGTLDSWSLRVKTSG